MGPNLRSRHRCRPSIDSLEGRCLLAVTVNEFPIPSHSGAVVAGLDSAIWFPQDDGQLGVPGTPYLTRVGPGATRPRIASPMSKPTHAACAATIQG